MNLLSWNSNQTTAEEWNAIHSPKPTADDKQIFADLVSLYTAFSERFAVDALGILSRNSGGKLVDPFVGSGTTLAAACRLGIDATGVDLDPFSALIARARVACSPDTTFVRNAIRRATNLNLTQEAAGLVSDLYQESDLRFAAAILQIFEEAVGDNFSKSFSAVLDDEIHKYDSEALLLASLAIAANKSARVVRGSNPVWLRKALNGELDDTEPLTNVCARAAERLIEIAQSNALNLNESRPRVLFHDARSLPIANCSVDLILTSPPYLNRLDYVVAHYPAIALMSDALKIHPEDLRRQMIGTTKIVQKDDCTEGLGPICYNVLERIQNHDSKASRSYYYWTYLQYFQSMKSVLSEIARIMKPNARGALVVQDSYYKEIQVAAPEILIEMAQTSGLATHVVRKQAIRGHMGKMSPTQRHHSPQKVLTEKVIFFSKSA